VSPDLKKPAAVGLVAALSLSGFAAQAAGPAGGPVRVYCCDVDGHRLCGDNLPAQCYSRAHQEISSSGAAKSFGPPPTPEQKAQLAAEQRKQKQEAEKAAEQRRRDAALVASYGSEKDIDDKRDRAVAEAQKNLQQAQDRYAAAAKRKQQLDNEAEFYLKRPMPAQLKAQVKENQTELAAQQKAVDDRKQDIEDIRARYAAEKQRYIMLTRGAPAPGGHQ
jgi:hypothetical protein